jgi:hypothetical protein
VGGLRFANPLSALGPTIPSGVLSIADEAIEQATEGRAHVRCHA